MRWTGFWRSGLKSFPISEEVVALFEGLNDVFVQQAETLSCGAVSSEQRYAVVEQLGRAGERYRDTIYANGFSGRQVALSAAEVRAFIGSCLPAVAHSIRDNQREDGLFHAYNRIRVSQGSADIIVLDKMLEGQVAALSAKVLRHRSASRCSRHCGNLTCIPRASRVISFTPKRH